MTDALCKGVLVGAASSSLDSEIKGFQDWAELTCGAHCQHLDRAQHYLYARAEPAVPPRLAAPAVKAFATAHSASSAAPATALDSPYAVPCVFRFLTYERSPSLASREGVSGVV